MSKLGSPTKGAGAPSGEALPYEQEAKLEKLFRELAAGFKKLDGVTDANKQNIQLKDLTNKMQEAKTLIRDFEREARMDSMPAAELGSRKKVLVQQLNDYIAMKKDRGTSIAAKQELIGQKRAGPQEKSADDMSTGDLIIKARKEIKDTDDALIRSEKLVQQAIEVGTKTAETLNDQTKQLERVVDDLDQIQFSLKKARQVIRDITRGIATDKCIMAFVLLIVVGVVVVIVLQILHIPKKAIIPTINLNSPSPSAVPSPATGRRMLEVFAPTGAR